MPFLLGRNNRHVRFCSEQKTAPEREHDPLNELDEYGTELHREARVWKVYVKETDQYDGDLVKGWNDSTDVILVFAALFSAISTAFLIESSKMLQEDPATLSAQTLQIISQTLLLVANGTQPPESTSSPNKDPTQFTPSHSAIWVNTLWYLSLSLSLAASFIAILAKDWCHSFMHGRTGHPYLQTRQRQQKWDMIERWKMPELLAALPSIIHLALFLFAFGLCIFLWNTHLVVALPVVCVCGVAFSFYVFSSVAAIFMDFFPYPTIISKVCRTEIAKRVFRVLYELPFSLGLTLVLILLIPFLLTMLVSGVISACLKSPLDYPFEVVYDWLDEWTDRVEDGPMKWLASRTPTTLLLLQLMFERSHKARSGGDNVTSLALGWLITFCEVPQSVDIALQSIAGATSRITRQPLVDCKAGLEILRRLASSSLYRDLDTKSEAVVLLYVRALSFLGTSANPNSDTSRKKGSELEASIWDLQAETERRVLKVAALIEEGDFEPTQSNLDALRIGSTVSSTILKILQNELEGSLVVTVFDSIADLLRSHLDNTTKLHDAALLAVTHAATLLLLFTPESIATRQNDSDIPLELRTICRNYPALFGECDYVDAHPLLAQCIQLAKRHQSGLVISLATTCILLYNTHEDQTRPANLTWSEEVVRGLIQRYSQDDVDLNRIYNIEPPGISAPEETYDLKHYISRLDGILLSNNPPDTPIAEIGRRTNRRLDEKVVSVELHALSSIYHLTSTTMLSPAIYFLIVEVMCRTPPPSPLFACGAQMLCKCPFPTMSDELATALEQRDIVPLLEATITSGNRTNRYFGQGQLWLLLSLYVYASDTASGQDKLKVQLDKCGRNGDESEENRHRELGGQLMFKVTPGNMIARELGVWAWRLTECVRQSFGYPIREGIHEALRDVPPEIRELSSFTAWPRRADDPSTNEPRPVEELTDEARERTDTTDVTNEDEGATGRDGHMQSPGLVADTGEAETLGDDAGGADSSRDLEAATLGPTARDGKSLADVDLQEGGGKVRGGEYSGAGAVGDGRRVADVGDTAEATDGPQSEGEEAESEELTQGGGKEAHRVIDMGGLEDESNQPTSSS